MADLLRGIREKQYEGVYYLKSIFAVYRCCKIVFEGHGLTVYGRFLWAINL